MQPTNTLPTRYGDSASGTPTSPFRAWCFTFNNPPNHTTILGSLQYCRYAIYQMETGESGTPHAQGYVEFSKPLRLAALKKMLPSAHWERRMGTREQAREYCMKEEGRISGPYEQGLFSSGGIGARNDLAELKRKIDEGATMEEIADDHFKEYLRYERGIQNYKRLKNPKRDWKSRVIVLVGDTGAGKSHYVRQNYPDAFWKQNSKWWCGYDNHETVVLDDFYGWLPWSILLNLLDAYPMTVETKGGNVNFVAKTIIITSNVAPDMWYDHTNPQMQFPALLRRIDQFFGAKVLEGQRILKNFDNNWNEFRSYVNFNTIEEIRAARDENNNNN